MNPEVTPIRFPHHPESVPAALKDSERWVTCDEHKVPLVAIPSGVCFAASSTDPATWRAYETALTTWQENEHIAGIGRVIEAAEGFVGIDLDDSLDLDTGELTPWALAIVERLNSFTETSPSLKGLKTWVKAPEITRAYKKPGLEVYPRGRYFTVTGLILNGSTQTVENRNEELQAILDEEFPKIDRSKLRHPGDGYQGPSRVLNLAALLERAQVEVFAELSDGAAERKYAIRCPWAHEHTGGDESGTYCGQYENGALFYACHHAHCAHRSWRDFRHHLKTLIYLGRTPNGTHNGRSRGGRLR